MLTSHQRAKYPSLRELFNTFHDTRLSHNFCVDPNLMAKVLAELGFYDSDETIKAKQLEKFQEMVDTL